MNRESRARLSAVNEKLAEILCELEEIRNEEEEAYDNLPEGIQQSERGEAMETAIDTLQEIYDNVESAQMGIDEITGKA